MSVKTNHLNKKGKLQDGFSLIELLIVLVILGVLVSLVLAGYNSSTKQFQRQSLATQLKTQFERARFDATKRRAMASNSLSKVEIGTNYFRMRTDLNLNGSVESAEFQDFKFDEAVAGKVVGDYDFPITVSFDRFGHASAVDVNNNPVSLSFRICDKNCSVSTATNSTIISISKTGTVAVTQGGTQTATLANPTWVSSVNANSGVNQTLKTETSY